MNLTLSRTKFSEDGIFGELTDENGTPIAVTLEHAYPTLDALEFIPKIPPGKFVCKRGIHELHRMISAFETFEITDVPGHSNILFHVGNYNRDSSGCVLIGSQVADKMILQSCEAFDKFMEMQNGVDEFTLEVKES